MKYFSPKYMMTITLLIWVILRIIAPFDFDVPPSNKAIIILISYIASFYSGILLRSLTNEISMIKRNNQKKKYQSIKVLEWNKHKINKVYCIFIFLALIGVLLRYYDLIVIKSYFSYGSSSNFKIFYEEAGVSFGIGSIISSILFPISISLIMLVIYFNDLISNTKKVVAWVIMSLVIYYFILRGGRTFITLALIMIISSLILSGRINVASIFKIIYKLRWIALVFTLSFFIYSAKILSERLTMQGFTFQTGLDYLQYAHHIQIKEYVLNWAQTSNILGAIIYTFISLLYYFLHGLYEFYLLVDHFSINNVTLGAFQFYPVFKLFNVLGFKTVTYDYFSTVIYQPGVYTTFFGPAFVDFGYIGFLYCFILGVISQHSWIGVRQNKLFHLMLYPYIAAVIFHSPFINMIQSGMGIYVLFAMIFSGFVFKINTPILKRN